MSPRPAATGLALAKGYAIRLSAGPAPVVAAAREHRR